MKLSAFKFELPEELIAQEPADNRDESRLMVVDREKGTIEHKLFKDVIDYFDEGDVFVTNNTKVFSAKLLGNKEKTDAEIKVTLNRELNRETHLWDVYVDPARKIRVGNKLYFGEGSLVAEVIDNTTSRGRTIRFLVENEDEFYKSLEALGDVLLPEYINREVGAMDVDRFQTIYAEEIGAVVAPAAGLHFTPHLLKKLELKGVDVTPVTLHVGLGSFSPVDVEDLTKHKTDSEPFKITEESAKMINNVLEKKQRICAVGVSSMRSIESSVSAAGRVKAIEGWTDKFIFPPFEFKIGSALITNFQAPESTLMMGAAAFGGYDLIMEAYQIAIKEKYKFLTYGDALLII
jgi:S-adenosylmethionine:tRNA ribosyltransferase-isomerase